MSTEQEYNIPNPLDLNTASSEEKQQALRHLIELTDSELTKQVLAIGMNAQEEDLVRIEAWRALGMASSSTLLSEIREAAGALVRNPDEDEDVQNYALQTLALLPATTAEIQLAQDVLEGDRYILVQWAAFSILTAHKNIPEAIHVLESLQSHTDFGVSAKRELTTI